MCALWIFCTGTPSIYLFEVSYHKIQYKELIFSVKNQQLVDLLCVHYQGLCGVWLMAISHGYTCVSSHCYQHF